MATPLAALNRITVPYTVSGKTHKARFYVIDHGTVSLDGYRTIDTRTSFVSWAAAIQNFAEKFAAHELGSSTTVDTCLYEEFDDPLWLPIQTYLPVDLTYLGGSWIPASQLTLTLRGGAFKKLKSVFMETVSIPAFHYTTPPTSVFFDMWKADGADANDPINWQVGRDNTFMQEAPYAGVGCDFNRKLRRARGV